MTEYISDKLRAYCENLLSRLRNLNRIGKKEGYEMFLSIEDLQFPFFFDII